MLTPLLLIPFLGIAALLLWPRTAPPGRLRAITITVLSLQLFWSLAVLVGNDREQMRHWFHTANRHTGGVPAEQVQRTEDLVEIVHYLDAMRARI